MTLTEREKAILYILLSDEDESVLADRLLAELRLSGEEWEELERDLNSFINDYLKRHEGKGGGRP